MPSLLHFSSLSSYQIKRRDVTPEFVLSFFYAVANFSKGIKDDLRRVGNLLFVDVLYAVELCEVFRYANCELPDIVGLTVSGAEMVFE